MAKKESESAELKCPVYLLLERLCTRCSWPSEVADHVRNAKVELLMAVRSVLDSRIDELRKRQGGRPGSRRIKVTEKA